jgi:hypothetical protein
MEAIKSEPTKGVFNTAQVFNSPLMHAELSCLKMELQEDLNMSYSTEIICSNFALKQFCEP